MDNRIVIEPAFKIREIARNALAGNWQRMFVGVFIYFFMLSGMMALLDVFFFTTRTFVFPYGQRVEMFIGYGSWLYELFVKGALTYGLSMFLLTFFRKKETDCGMVFEGFSIFIKTFLLYLLYAVKVFLWSLLFGIPGIVASYRYSQCFYLQADHPDWSASQCINESKRLMLGNKGKLFYLNLTFIGWYILASLPSMLTDLFDTTGIISVIIWLIMSIPLVAVDLYRFMSQTVFYELVTENLVVVGNNREGEF